MKKIRKHSRTGTERGSELDRMIERLGGSGGYGGGKNLYKTKMSDRRAAKVKEAAKAVTKPKRQRSGKLMKGSRVQYPSPNKPAGGRTKVVSDAAARVRARNEKLEKQGKITKKHKAVLPILKKARARVDANATTVRGSKATTRVITKEQRRKQIEKTIGKPVDWKNVRKNKKPRIHTSAKVAAGVVAGAFAEKYVSKKIKKKAPVVIKKKSPVAKKKLRMDKIGKPSRYTTLKKRKG